jgi:hypothetical protein
MSDKVLSPLDHFLRRIDAHVNSLASDNCRRVFLNQEIDRCQGRYSRFIARRGGSQLTTDLGQSPQAADFLLTISALVQRRTNIGRYQLQRDAQERLNTSIRNFLVSADQLCPTIIGQAHVLFAASENQLRIIAEKIATEVKKDTQELMDAIIRLESSAKMVNHDSGVKVSAS